MRNPDHEPADEGVRETLALLAILALGNDDIARGAVSPIEEVVARIRSPRNGRT